ncbi:MAG: 5-formyltetrahydrofolate cyclo-ligase [Alphaproteobacteria bacterium]|jgi:5-formyltetrahydrofolate cyclo-ligase|nr:5-formyltetrahydrofolate cyclo-ligase [Candidatus Jidaibacter sp.]
MKQSLREKILKKRNSLTQDDKSNLDSIIYDKIYAFLSNQKSKIIGLYYSIGSEVETHTLINILLDEGFKIALPSINEYDTLTFIEISSTDDLYQGKFCLEPHISIEHTVIPEIIMLPLVAFDKHGNRIGYGKGYYDKTLVNFENAKKVGIAYAFQEIDYQNIYCNDVKLECIITDQQIIYTS